MMTKREYTAIAVLALLLALSVWNLKSIDTLTGDIEIALSKSQSAAEKLDFKTARQRLDEGLELWLSADSYTHIFLRHPEIDSMNCSRCLCRRTRRPAPPHTTSCAITLTASTAWSTCHLAASFDSPSVRSLESSSMKVFISLKLR